MRAPSARASSCSPTSRPARPEPCHQLSAAVGTRWHSQYMATVDDIRAVARDLPRSYERVVGDRLKFKVGQYVYASLSRDETLLGFAFPREERAALVAGDPERFLLP